MLAKFLILCSKVGGIIINIIIIIRMAGSSKIRLFFIIGIRRNDDLFPLFGASIKVMPIFCWVILIWFWVTLIWICVMPIWFWV